MFWFFWFTSYSLGFMCSLTNIEISLLFSNYFLGLNSNAFFNAMSN